MKTKLLKLTALASLVATLSACGQQGAAPQAEQEVAAAKQPASIQLASLAPQLDDGKSAIALGDAWLLTSEAQGLLLLDSRAEKIQTRLAGNYEALAVHGDLVVTVDQNTNQASILNKHLQTLKTMPAAAFQVEQVCLYQDSSKHVYAVLLGGRGQAEQKLIWDGQAQQPRWHSVRKLSLPANAAACSIDDQRNILYVLEEELGIWAYAADTDANYQRELIDLQAPRGNASDEFSGLAATKQGLLALGLDKKLYYYQHQADKSHQLKQSWELKADGLVEPELLQYRVASGQLSLVDDDSGRYFQHTLKLNESDAQHEQIVSIPAQAQTEPMARFGDTADDPAIWYNTQQPSLSRVIATDKRQGLKVYDLQGNLLQFLDTGRLNNVDVRYNVQINGVRKDLAVATLRNNDALALYSIEQDSGQLRWLASLETGEEKIYGFCLYQEQGTTYAFANFKSGLYVQYQLLFEQQPRLNEVRRFELASQPEGCVADDKNQLLYVGEEDHGVWLLGASPNASTKLQAVAEINDKIHADVEGLALYQGEQQNYLVISSQGNDSYVVLDAKAPFAYKGRFRIGVNAEKFIDGSSETDGLEVSSHNFGGIYHKGLMVVQDGHNVMPKAPQNFKYVAWQQVVDALKL